MLEDKDTLSRFQFSADSFFRACLGALFSCKMESTRSSTQTQKRPVKPLQSNNPRTQYLILYNFVSALLWLVVLGRVALLVPLVGFGRVYQGVGQFTKWTQTLALLEVVHSATGESCFQNASLIPILV